MTEADEGSSVGVGMSDEEYFSSYEDVQVTLSIAKIFIIITGIIIVIMDHTINSCNISLY